MNIKKSFEKISNKIKVTIGVVILALIVIVFLWFYYAPVRPTFNFPDENTFIDDTATIRGQIITDCNCDVFVKYKDEFLELDENNWFEKELIEDPEKNYFVFSVTGITKGKGINFTSEKNLKKVENFKLGLWAYGIIYIERVVRKRPKEVYSFKGKLACIKGSVI